MLFKSIILFGFIVITSCYEPPNSDVLPPYNRGTSGSGSSHLNDNGYRYNNKAGLNAAGNGLLGSATSHHATTNAVSHGNVGGSGGGVSGSHGSSSDKNAQILKQSLNIDPDGSFQYEFDTDNGIHVQEEGNQKSLGGSESVQNVHGQFSYTSPEGQQIVLTYIADENGFQPQGAHLPTPPPIPAAIQRAIDYIQAHGSSQNLQTAPYNKFK